MGCDLVVSRTKALWSIDAEVSACSGSITAGIMYLYLVITYSSTRSAFSLVNRPMGHLSVVPAPSINCFNCATLSLRLIFLSEAKLQQQWTNCYICGIPKDFIYYHHLKLSSHPPGLRTSTVCTSLKTVSLVLLQAEHTAK